MEAFDDRCTGTTRTIRTKSAKILISPVDRHSLRNLTYRYFRTARGVVKKRPAVKENLIWIRVSTS
jgi:hypothetical protein